VHGQMATRRLMLALFLGWWFLRWAQGWMVARRCSQVAVGGFAQRLLVQWFLDSSAPTAGRRRSRAEHDSGIRLGLIKFPRGQQARLVAMALTGPAAPPRSQRWRCWAMRFGAPSSRGERPASAAAFRCPFGRTSQPLQAPLLLRRTDRPVLTSRLAMPRCSRAWRRNWPAVWRLIQQADVSGGRPRRWSPSRT